MSADDIRHEIDASRRAIQGDFATLSAELDFVSKTKRAVVERPLPWLGGAALLGYVLSGRRRKKKKSRKNETEPARRLTILGILLGLFRFLLPIARPLATEFATRKLSEFAARRQP